MKDIWQINWAITSPAEQEMLEKLILRGVLNKRPEDIWSRTERDAEYHEKKRAWFDAVRDGE